MKKYKKSLKLVNQIQRIRSKNNKLGIWKMKFEYPWIWRKKNR